MSEERVEYSLSALSFFIFFVFAFAGAVVLEELGGFSLWVRFIFFVFLGFSILFYFLIWYFKIEGGKMKDTWQFKFLSFNRKGNIKTINSCDVPGLLCESAILVVIVALIYLFAFFLAKKPNIENYLKAPATIPYEKWPTFFGYRIWPISIVVLWGILEFVVWVWSFDYSGVVSSMDFSMSWEDFLWFLGTALLFPLVFYTNEYLKSEKWQKTKQAIKDSFQIILGKVCYSKATGVSEKQETQANKEEGRGVHGNGQ